MITIAKARKILGKEAIGQSDEQIEETLRECLVLTDMFWDQQTTKTPLVIDRTRRNTKMVMKS